MFGEPGDLVLLGARSLEGLNLRVDLVAKRLVSAGPMLAAAGAHMAAARDDTCVLSITPDCSPKRMHLSW